MRTAGKNTLVRSHSNSSRDEAAKRMRDDTSDMETQDDILQAGNSDKDDEVVEIEEQL